MRPYHDVIGRQVENALLFDSPVKQKMLRVDDRETYASIGHNSQHSVECVAADTTSTSDEPIKFLYAQIHVGDWISGTLGMTPELEGAYFRFLIRLYDRGRALPDDDRLLCSAMGLTIRVWRRLKEALVGLGKIIIRNGCLTNDRFEKERIKRAEMLRKQADAALKRHAEARARKQGLPEVSAKFEPSLPETSSKLLETIAKKVNEINETLVTGSGNPRILESYNLNKKKNKSPDGDSSSDQLALVPSDPSLPEKKLTASVAARSAFEMYNETAKRAGLPVARTLDKARATSLAHRVKEAGGLEGFQQAMANLEASSFCKGKNDRGWKADLNFVCQTSSFSRLLEGGYADATGSPKPDDKFDREMAGMLGLNIDQYRRQYGSGQ